MNRIKIKTFPDWYILIPLIFFEFFLFKFYIDRNITPFYPISFDQAYYLLLTYQTYDNIQTHGLITGLLNSPTLATGILFPIQAVFFYLFLGASRFTALLPNFIYFIFLQIFSISAVKSASKNPSLWLICIGYLLAISSPFFDAGGLSDFRMDFIALCAYGIMLSCAIKSRFFLEIRWSLLTLVSSIILIGLRGITAIYLLALFSSLCFYFSVTPKNPENKKRLKNLLCITFILLIYISAYIWMNYDALYNYYMVGHILGDENIIRLKEAQINNVFSYVFFYPKSLFYHLGVVGSFIIISLCLLALSPFFLKKNVKTRNNNDADFLKTGIIFFLFSLLIPLFALTLDKSKSPIVANIMIIPLFFLTLFGFLYSESCYPPSLLTKKILKIAAILIFTAGLLNTFKEFHHFKSKLRLKNLNEITKMYMNIGDYAFSHHHDIIQLSVDQIADYLSASAISVVYYEKKQKILTIVVKKMGSTIFSVKKEDVISSLKKSDFFIMNKNNYQDSVFPYNQSINALKPFIKKYASNHFNKMEDYEFMGSTYSVLVNKQFPFTKKNSSSL